MKANENTMKVYARQWRKQIDSAYSAEFDRLCAQGYYMATGHMKALSVLKGLLNRAMNGDSDVWMDTDTNGRYTGMMVIREIPALYELGTDFNLSTVQSCLRGIDCRMQYENVMHVTICLDLNSATIYDFGKLIKLYIATIKADAQEAQQDAENAAQMETTTVTTGNVTDTTENTMENVPTASTTASTITTENVTSATEKPVELSTGSAYPATAHHETGAG